MIGPTQGMGFMARPLDHEDSKSHCSGTTVHEDCPRLPPQAAGPGAGCSVFSCSQNSLWNAVKRGKAEWQKVVLVKGRRPRSQKRMEALATIACCQPLTCTV